MASRKAPARKASLEEARHPSPRDLLIDRVSRGDLTSDNAEAEAGRLGLRPLRDDPDPALFDPMKETWWTIPMTIAWIVWRSADAVREQWDAYRTERWWWTECTWRDGATGTVYTGSNLERVPAATWPLLALNTDYPKNRTRSFPYRPRSPAEARGELWEALGDGFIVAEAVDLIDGERVPIPASAWKDLDIVTEHGRDRLCTDALSRAGYGDARIRSSTITDAWPPAARRIDVLPPLIRPEGSGYMPLSAAAQWIATKGGTVEVGLSDIKTWDGAYRELVDRIASEEVAATGTHEGRSQKVPAAMFAGIVVRHLFGSEEIDDAGSTELYLFSYPYVDDEHWRVGFDDSLRNRYRTSWTRLMVLKEAVYANWPPETAPAVIRGQGRPSDAERIMSECRRRIATGAALLGLAEEALVLERWLVKQPEPIPTKAVTIENLIREDHRQYREAHEKK